jgi:hypothetical protein
MGIAVGINAAGVPIFIKYPYYIPNIKREIVPFKLSGRFGTFTNTTISLGIMIASILGLGFTTDPEAGNINGYWRFVFGFPLILLTTRIMLF